MNALNIKRWMKEDDILLKECYEDKGMSRQDIRNLLHCTEGSLQNRIRDLVLHRTGTYTIHNHATRANIKCRKWSSEETKNLYEWTMQGISTDVIAKRLNKTVGAVARKRRDNFPELRALNPAYISQEKGRSKLKELGVQILREGGTPATSYDFICLINNERVAVNVKCGINCVIYYGNIEKLLVLHMPVRFLYIPEVGRHWWLSLDEEMDKVLADEKLRG